MTTPTGYTVPASRVLTAVHRADPDQPTRTLCGEQMTADGLWVPWAYEPGRDRLCRGCAGQPAFEDTPLL